jgi:nitric oxide reductase NorD protein
LSKDTKESATLGRRTAKTYQESLPEIMLLLDLEVLQLWQSIIKNIAEKEKKVAIEFIRQTKKVLSVIPVNQRQNLLISTGKFVDLDIQASLAFFSNASLVMAILEDLNFRKWESTAFDLAKENSEVAVIFLNMTPKILSHLEMEELLVWVESGKKLHSVGPKVAKAFFEGSFSGLANSFCNTSREERAYLLDIGSQLALVNWKCVQSYFENALEVIREIKAEDFAKWAYFGRKISEETAFYGSDYYNNSFSSLKKVNPIFHELIFKNAQILLDKDRLLVGIYFENLSHILSNIHPKELGKWVEICIRIFETNREIAIDYLRNSPTLLEALDVTELEEWAMNGLVIFKNDPANAMLYFSLKSRSSKESVEQLMSGVALKRVSRILNYYAYGISEINFAIRSHNLLPEELVASVHPVVSGKTIYLTPTMKGYGDFEDNFRIYKLSVMHEVGHTQFGTSKYEVGVLLPLFEKMAAAIDISSLENVAENEKETVKTKVYEKQESENEISVDLSAVIGLFPNPFIATDIMGIIEDARVEYKVLNMYRGLKKEFEKVREQMITYREPPEGKLEKFMEVLLMVSVGHDPSFENDEVLKVQIEDIKILLENKIFRLDSSTLDSLKVTFDIYSMLEECLGSLESSEYSFIRNLEYRGQGIGLSSSMKEENEFTEQMMERFIPHTILNLDEDKIMQDELKSGPRCAIAKKWAVLGSYAYDEWDSQIKDYKSEWCTVYEVSPTGESSDFYKETMEHYAHEISFIRRIFKMMKPLSFRKLRRQSDGDELDFDAITEAFTDRKCGLNPTERLYIRWDKHERDVATLFLVDISASTSKEINNGKRILDVEKEALVIMTQALESIGDQYAIYAFSGNTRADVEYYGIKDFGEKLSDDVECKIGSLEPAYNTRLGSAIRHSIAKLKQVDAKIKLLILLSDGEPYDFGFADEKYQGQSAIEDTKMAIQEGKTLGIHFFCITVDSEASNYMDSLFSDVGYTIIDNAATLPERLPILYNHITT